MDQTLYRAASYDEPLSIKSTKIFVPEFRGASSEGKYFATSLCDACKWGRKFFLFDKRAFHVVSFDVPTTVIASLFYQPNLDGIGKAYFAAAGVELNAVNHTAQGMITEEKGLLI